MPKMQPHMVSKNHNIPESMPKMQKPILGQKKTMKTIIITPTKYGKTQKKHNTYTTKDIGGKGKTIKHTYNQIHTKKDDIIILIDDDEQHPKKYIKNIKNHLLKNRLDLVIGARNLKEYPLYKKITNKLATIYCNKIAHTKLTDSESGFRAMTKTAADTLITKNPANHYDFEIAMNILAQKNNLKIGEIKIDSPWKKGRTIAQQIKDAKKIIQTGWKLKT